MTGKEHVVCCEQPPSEDTGASRMRLGISLAEVGINPAEVPWVLCPLTWAIVWVSRGCSQEIMFVLARWGE